MSINKKILILIIVDCVISSSINKFFINLQKQVWEIFSLNI